jgi:transcriptional regulator with XRE-family HTH domain
MEHQEIKFKETLAELLRESGKSRREICEALDITPSALSQYLHGSATPGLQKLVDLAGYLGVSLDYLLLKTKQPETPVAVGSADAFAKIITASFARAEEQHIRQAQSLDRLGAALTKEMKDIAARIWLQIAQETAKQPALPEMWTDLDLVWLETNSLATQILTFDMRFDIVQDEHQPGVFHPGSFFPIVQENLRNGRSYQFLLVGTVDFWLPTIRAFRGMLPGETLALCEFRCTTDPIIAGCGLYHLDVATLQKDTMLFERVKDNIDDHDWAGYAMTPAIGYEADVKMDVKHVHLAQDAFKRLWERAKDWRT